jgi:Uma2 family endonuclease
MALSTQAVSLESKLAAKTYDDLLAMPEDGNRYELIFGEIVMTASPKSKHQYALFQLGKLIDAFARDNRLGVVYVAPYDVKLSAHNVVQPDILFVLWSRRTILTENYVDGPPDLIVEVLSPTNRANDLIRKATLYADFGVPEYWIADPETDDITVHVLESGHYRPRPNRSGIVDSVVLPGLAVRIQDVFALPGWASTPEDETE